MSTTKKQRRAPAPRPGLPGGVRDENRRARTRQLADAALALYLEHGLAAVTVDQIVERAGVAKGSFYRYFDDQTALVAALVAPMSDAMMAALDTAEARLAGATVDELPAIYLELAKALIAATAPVPGVLRLYLQECRSPPTGARRPIGVLADHITRRSVHLSQIALDFGLLRESDPRVNALTVIGAVERVALGVLTGEDVGRFDALPVNLISVILDGVRRRRAPR